MVQPYPVPTEVSANVVSPSDNSDIQALMLTITTPSGATVVFLDKDNAAKIGQGILDAANSMSGLIVPKQKLLTPHPQTRVRRKGGKSGPTPRADRGA